MDGCGDGKGGCGPVRPAGLGGLPTEPVGGFPGALYVWSKSIVIGGNGAVASNEQIVFSCPPAAAVDVFIRYRAPDGSAYPGSNGDVWRIYAVQEQGSFLLDQTTPVTLGTNGRILAARDFPAKGYDITIDAGSVALGTTLYWDVMVIGWAKEPVGFGPIPLTEMVESTTQLRWVGLPLMATNPNSVARYAWLGYHALHQATFSRSINTLPTAQFLSSPTTRSNNDFGPLLTDNAGNLKVVLSSGASGTVFPAASALADDDANPTTTRVGANALFFDGTTWDRGRSGFITAQTPTGWQNVLSSGVFNSSPPSLTNGQAITLQLTSAGNLKNAEQFQPVAEDNTNGVIAVQVKPLAATTYVYTRDIDFGTVTKKNTKASTGNVFGFHGQNDNTAGRYFQLHNKATAPAATDVPIYSIYVPGGSSLVVGREFFGPAGINFATGIGWAWSTTKATFTDAATAGDHTTHVHFV